MYNIFSRLKKDDKGDIHILPALQNKYPTNTRVGGEVWFSTVGQRINGRFIPMEA